MGYYLNELVVSDLEEETVPPPSRARICSILRHHIHVFNTEHQKFIIHAPAHETVKFYSENKQIFQNIFGLRMEFQEKEYAKNHNPYDYDNSNKADNPAVIMRALNRHSIIKQHVRYMSKFLNVISEVQHYKTPVPQKCDFLPLPLYGGKYMVTLLVGAGVGKELMQFVKEVIEVGRTPIKFEEIFAPKSTDDCERDLHHIKTSIRRNRVALKGCIETKDKAAEKSQFNLNIKSELDLYISIVHCRPYVGVKCLNPNIDIILARQNTEGEYLMLEHETVKGNVESLKVITKEKTEQYAKWALHYARAHHRNKVTIVHKRDVFALADGVFVDTIKEQARDFKDLRFNTMSLTNFLEQLIKRPQTLDFVMIPNLYGCVATNIVCGLLGGPGLLSKKSYSDYYAVFEPAVGSLATQLEGKDSANPVATLNALRDMLAYLKMEKDATAIDCAIRRTLGLDKIHTPDIGGNGKTSEFMERVKFHIRNFFCSQPR